MDDKILQLLLFDRYTKQQLSQEESEEFEKNLKQDTALAKEFTQFQSMTNGIRSYYDQQVKTRIQTVESKLEAEGFFFNEENISDYLLGKMNADGQKILEQRIEQDPAFAQKVAKERSILSGIKSYQLKQKIAGIDKKMIDQNRLSTKKTKQLKTTPQFDQDATTAKLVPLWQKLSMAAGFLILLSIGFWWFNSQSLDVDKVYANNYEINIQQVNATLEKLGDVGAFDSDAEQKNSLFNAIELFSKQQYDRTSDALTKHLKKFLNDDTALFYSGLNEMERQNFKTASQSFKQLIQQMPSSEWNDSAQWYMALAHLKIPGETALAKTLFLQIIGNESNPYNIKAKELLDQI